MENYDLQAVNELLERESYRHKLELESLQRELNVEASLEKVRVATSAMRRSKEFPNVALVMTNEMAELGIAEIGSSISIVDDQKQIFTSYTADTQLEDGSKYLVVQPEEKIDAIWISRESYRRRLSGEDNFTVVAKNEQIEEFIKYRIKQQGTDGGLKKAGFKTLYFHFFAFYENSVIVCATLEPLSDLNREILKRFANVFGMSYTRFLDLQKAEAQTREAQIELGLERVRARAMAMKKSNELKELIGTVQIELTRLNVALLRCAIMIYEADKKSVRWWMANPEIPNEPMKLLLKYHEMPPYLAFLEAWKLKEERFVYYLAGDDKKEWDEYTMRETELSMLPDFLKESMRASPETYLSASFNEFGNLTISTDVPLSDEHFNILVRFSRVFGQTYTRFNDLQKAEAQAREAQIEVALERIRSRSMAMHNSSELNEVMATIWKEFEIIGSEVTGIFLFLFDKMARTFEWHMAGNTVNSGLNIVKIPYLDHTVFQMCLENWETEIGMKNFILKGDLKDSWESLILKETPLSNLPDDVKAYMLSFQQVVMNSAPNKFGLFTLASHNPVNDETKDILGRFNKVFEQTYTRFLDLQKAEAQAREAIKQASLDRVRGEIASMRSTEDLQRITPLIWHELTALGVPFFRCGVFIVDEAHELVHSYLSTPDGLSLGVLDLPFGSNDITSQVVTYWRKNQVFMDHWDKEQFVAWVQSLVEQHRLQSEEVYQASQSPPESLYLNFIPFKQGMLYVGNTSELSSQEIDLVQTLASAFSIAYARYEDFKQLEEAKAKVEATLDTLKSTQAQLIQAEKMASLGELTAGIAHEIQNPLNFVNNYSEVNIEIVEDIDIEVAGGNLEEIKNLLLDLKDNEHKIHHHGKRAEAIVRSMLQHSRINSGTKELTNLNTLADEYLRLAYQGMRSKDDAFEADYVTDFDEKLPMLEIAPSDMGRVFLNIINNAFQACAERSRITVVEKRKAGLENYHPTVKLSTRMLENSVEIRISDNGNGIPKDIQDKIFQPFFTTKPTGQGTGLGLSLAYDIVKAQGGELTMESEPGKGTEFKIRLNV